MNRDYLYTRDMIDSGRTAELTAGERMREAADLARTEAKESASDVLVGISKHLGHTIAIRQVITEIKKLADQPGRTDEHRLLLSVLLERIKGLQP
jgi:hypothetical protein